MIISIFITDLSKRMLVNVFRILWYLMLLLFNLNLTLSRRAAVRTFDIFCGILNIGVRGTHLRAYL